MSDQVLTDNLRKLRPSGPEGFEGLIAKLMSGLTGRQFALARAGSQSGRDMTSGRLVGNVVAVECKRYGNDTELSERELLGELVQAARDIPDLDIWVLVASRPIPAQLADALTVEGNDRGIQVFTISSGDGSPSSLSVLCASALNITVDHIASFASGADAALVVQFLNTVAADSGFAQSAERLRSSLLKETIGYSNWRTEHNKWFLARCSSEADSRASFGQLLNVTDADVRVVQRTVVWRVMDEWLLHWRDRFCPLILTGEEGDGKTWSTASWLADKVRSEPAFPGVLFLSSIDAASDDPGVLLTRGIMSGMLAADDRYWHKRLKRWITRPESDNPLMLVVLDGINERRSPTWWRGLLEQLTASPWNRHIALIATCRTAFWRRSFRSLRHLLHQELPVPPYDNTELSEALREHGLDPSELPHTLLPLIRKPRYLDLTVRYRRRMAESGDVTPARLIYEDWRDRYERKTTTPLDDTAFQDLIRELARKRQAGDTYLDSQDLEGLLSLQEDKLSVLQELSTGGILRHEGGRYQVAQPLLVQGFGLLLSDQVQQAYPASAEELDEVIASWLEPQAEMDIKCDICGVATLHALTVQGYPLESQVALLRAWIGTHNPTPEVERSFAAYLPLSPQSYLALAEYIWSDVHDNPWGQDLILSALIRWHGSDKVILELIPAFERWLGYVHRDGDPMERDRPNRDLDDVRATMAARVGHKLVLGEFEFAGYHLTVVEDDGLLRLGRLALIVITHVPRELFARALAVGCVAESIMGIPTKYDLFAWAVRTSSRSISTEIQREAKKLLRAGNIAAQQAAYRLLSFEGGVESVRLQRTLPDDLFPSPLWEAYRNDPCASGFSWRYEDVEPCLKRTDLEGQWVARQLKGFCINPNLSVAEDLGERLAPIVAQIDVASLWNTLYQTSDSVFLEEVEPALCAYAPQALVSLARSVAKEIVLRHDLPLRQLAFRLDEYLPLMGRGEREPIVTAWLGVQDISGPWTKTQSEAEWALFTLVLQVDVDADTQLAHLAQRREEAMDLVKFERLFRPASDIGGVLRALEGDIDVKTLKRVLWFVSRSAANLDEKVIQHLRIYLSHDDSLIRSLTMQILYLAEDAAGLQSIVQGSWAFDKDREQSFENGWGSHILCRFGSPLSYAELRTRVHPKYLGNAVRQRGMQPTEVAQYAADIHRLWQNLKSPQVELPTDFPPVKVERSSGDDQAPDERFALGQSEFSRSIAFASRNAFWGGVTPTGSMADIDFSGSCAEERQMALVEIARQAIREQHEAGNDLFAHYVSIDGLEEALVQRPDLFDEMIEAALAGAPDATGLLVRGQGLYEALCRVLFKKKPALGVALYGRLNEAHLIRFVQQDTQIRLLDHSLFAASGEPDIAAECDTRLAQCNTDQELMELVIVAEMGNGNGREWLRLRIDQGLESTVPLYRARALAVLAFTDDESARQILERESATDADTWETHVAERALRRWQTNAWAKHWFGRFLTVESDVNSWAAFRLFLGCVDRRFYKWKDRVVTNTEVHTGEFDRLIFLESQQDTIRNRVKRNEDPLKDTFLCEKILDNHSWRWVGIGE